MNYQRLLSLTRQAVQDYDMIRDGDRIAVAVSGGKDSLTLALALNGLSHFYPKHFTLHAYSVDLGFENMDFSPLEPFFRKLQIPYTIIHTQIKQIVFDVRREQNPCSLCAKLRKGALYNQAVLDGCRKAALGHHREDAVSTLLISSLYEGRLETFAPVTYLDRTGITIIRPLLYCPEKEIIDYANREHLPVIQNACPADGNTKRKEAEDLLRTLTLQDPEIPKRLFTAIQRSSLEGWHQEDKP